MTSESLAPEQIYGAGVRGTRGVGLLRRSELTTEESEMEEIEPVMEETETEEPEQAVYELLKDYIDAALASSNQDTTEAIQEQPEEEDMLITHGADITIVMLLGMIFGLSLWGAFSRRFFA